jgi:hypothetical protein
MFSSSIKTVPPSRVTAAILEPKNNSLYFTHQFRVTHLREVTEVYSNETKEKDKNKEFNTILEKMESLNLLQLMKDERFSEVLSLYLRTSTSKVIQRR